MQPKKRTTTSSRQVKAFKPVRKQPQPVPFDFVLEHLDRARPHIRPMFGCHAVYIGDKIVLILRKKESGKRDNGIWLATGAQHHESLKKDFPIMRSIKLFGGNETAWQVIPLDAEGFEENAIKVCELILRGDPRIGKIPAKKRAKKI